jgi:hypothetical protein
MKTFTQRKHAVRLARLLRTLAIIVVLGGIAMAADRLPIVHHADAAAASETVVITSSDYFPAQFPAPKGEPEAHVEAF